MKLKYFLYVLCCSFPLVWASCLGDEQQIDYTLSSDAQILTFKLSHDSIGELASVSYTVDQLQGYIFNKDSLPFGLESRIKQFTKAIFTYTTAVGGGNISVITEDEDINNPAFINSGDSIDILSFLNTRHKYLRVYAMDGTKKEYSLDLRAHLVDPDLMVYERISDHFSGGKVILWKDTFYTFSGQYNVVNYNDTLYRQTPSGNLEYSSDTLTWTPIPLSGDVASGKVAAVLGEIQSVPGRSNSLHLLSLIVKINEKPFFVKTDLHQVWVKGDTVPPNFPLQDFSAVSWRKGGAHISNLTLIKGGVIWCTQGDISTGWVKISAPQLVQGGAFAAPEASSIFYYDDKLHLINGTGYNNMVYTSIDGGLTWLKMSDKYLPPVEYECRKNASVCVKDSYVYIFGGENQAGVLSDVWRARLNRLGFEN